jgi:hypothetical protein
MALIPWVLDLAGDRKDRPYEMGEWFYSGKSAEKRANGNAISIDFQIDYTCERQAGDSARLK